MRICRVLDLSGGPGYALPGGCLRTAVVVPDHTDAAATLVSEVLPVCHAAMDAALAAGGCVLVHCAMGASRSATVIISWLMATRGWTLRRALNHCKRRRHQVRPNNGFFTALRDLDRKLHGGVDSFPLDTVDYMRWMLEHPRGERAARGVGCCTIL